MNKVENFKQVAKILRLQTELQELKENQKQFTQDEQPY
jgi:hypothetical protein